jgi:hypothetical protein
VASSFFLAWGDLLPRFLGWAGLLLCGALVTAVP